MKEGKQKQHLKMMQKKWKKMWKLKKQKLLLLL